MDTIEDSIQDLSEATNGCEWKYCVYVAPRTHKIGGLVDPDSPTSRYMDMDNGGNEDAAPERGCNIWKISSSLRHLCANRTREHPRNTVRTRERDLFHVLQLFSTRAFFYCKLTL